MHNAAESFLGWINYFREGPNIFEIFGPEVQISWGSKYSITGQSTYKVIRNFVAPRKPAECDYAIILECLKYYYSPKPSIIVQISTHDISSKENASLSLWQPLKHRQIAQFCEYEGTLKDMLRDRLVCEVNHTCIQKRLLAETDLPFKLESL